MPTSKILEYNDKIFHHVVTMKTTVQSDTSPKQILIKDLRDFFVLPQKPEDAGYYAYGTPSNGQGQFAHPKLISFILSVANDWSETDRRLIGIGNISLAGGVKFNPHHGHMSGLEVDVRPLRKDGKNEAISITDAQYDHEGTKKLIALFLDSGKVQRVRFNDSAIPKVIFTPGHANHFHVDLS